jgi:CubicO group peptidase (beta-lactamase class C family)
MFDIEAVMAEHYIPGASVAVIDGGEIAWAESYGVLEAGKAAPVSAETRFQAASISKPVAALAALGLVQEGRLALDEDIRGYQTSWRLPENDGWQPRVTLRQLLSHSGGITVTGFLGYPTGARVPTLRQVLDGEKPANSAPILVDTVPGLHFRYSGGGYTILQRLIEDVTGKPFWQVLQERILEPAGMVNSTYRYPLPEAWQEAAASGHRSDGDPLAGKWHTYPESAAAGLWTTPLDLARLIVLLERTLRGEAEQILSRSMLEEMFSPQIALRGIGLDGWEGLGVFITGEGDDLYCGHGGSNEGYRSQFIIRKGKGQAGIIMTNADSGDDLNDEWLGTIALEYGWTSFTTPLPEPIQLGAEALEQFTGQYQSEAGMIIHILAAEDGLRAEMQGQPPLFLRPRSADRFFFTQVNAEIQFTFDDGECSGLVFKQNGEELAARWVK